VYAKNKGMIRGGTGEVVGNLLGVCWEAYEKGFIFLFERNE